MRRGRIDLFDIGRSDRHHGKQSRSGAIKAMRHKMTAKPFAGGKGQIELFVGNRKTLAKALSQVCVDARIVDVPFVPTRSFRLQDQRCRLLSSNRKHQVRRALR
jgi:hypothetical protein